jgi:hypothetical protein
MPGTRLLARTAGGRASLRCTGMAGWISSSASRVAGDGTLAPGARGRVISLMKSVSWAWGRRWPGRRVTCWPGPPQAPRRHNRRPGLPLVASFLLAPGLPGVTAQLVSPPGSAHLAAGPGVAGWPRRCSMQYRLQYCSKAAAAGGYKLRKLRPHRAVNEQRRCALDPAPVAACRPCGRIPGAVAARARPQK